MHDGRADWENGYAQYEWHVGRLESAYALLSDASRRSFATGLQRVGTSSRLNASPKNIAAKKTFLSLYCYER